MRISPFQMYENDDLTGIVKKNNLAYRSMIESQNASKMITLIHAANQGASVSSYLDRFPTMTLNSDDDFKWKLMATGNKNVPLTEARLTLNGSAISVTDQAGRNHTDFYLVFPEAYFYKGNTIVGHRNELYPIRIQDGPISLGSNFAYRCTLVSGDPDLFIPYDELQGGKRFSKDFTGVEKELSKEGGGIHRDFPIEMINTFTMIRMENTIPGSMINRPVKFDFVGLDSNGKKKVFTTWLDYETYNLEMQFMDEIAHMIMYSTSNKTDQGTYKQRGSSGNVLQYGAGIKEQMEASNYDTYNTFNIDKFTDILMDLSVGKTPQGQRELVVATGEWGMYQFHQAMEDKVSLYTPLFDNSRVKKSGNKMSFGGQFLEYSGPNGIKVTVVHDALKDDRARNKIDMPGKSGKAESYVYDILNMGTSDGSPNIQKVYLKNGGLIRGYEPGLRSPYTTDSAATVMSTSVDAWKEHRAFTGGAIVKDPTRTATYKPNILSV